MKALTKLTAIVVIGCLFTGCSGKRIDVATLSYGTTDKNDIMDMFGTRASRKFHFRLHKKNYSFLEYAVPSSADTVGFLFEESKLVAANKTAAWWSGSSYDSCIVFPLSPEDNTGECLLNATNGVIASRHPLETLAFAPDDIDVFETFAYTLEFATYAALGYPILMVGAAFMPIYLVDYWQYSETQDGLAAEFRLGEPIEKYEKLLEEYPGHIISKSSKGASVLLPAGIFFKKPAFSVGIQDGKIIWLDEHPRCTCSSGFSINGCRLGKAVRTPEKIEYGDKNGQHTKNTEPRRQEDYGNFWGTSY